VLSSPVAYVVSSAASCVAVRREAPLARKATPVRATGSQLAMRRLVFQPVAATCAASSVENSQAGVGLSCGSPVETLKPSTLACTSPVHVAESNWVL
jgi:hypothetical protein